jgi:isopenicillin N synthase-like dioxygenase
MDSFHREIPIIDFASLTSPVDDLVRKQMLATLRGALETCGFMYLRNHGVAQSLVDAVFAQSRQFFRYRRKLRTAPSPMRRAVRAAMKASVCKRLKSGGPAI